MNSKKRQKDMTLKDKLTRSIGAHMLLREEWRNNTKKNEETEPKQQQYTVVAVTMMEIKSESVRSSIE